MESLTGINSFVRAAESLSFVAAGRLLGISPSAVGKNIAALEASLGVRLFQRTTRRITLTEEGALFYERCRRILDDLRDAQALVSQATETPRGLLRISLPTIGYRFLLPVLPEFRRLYPEVELDLNFNDRIVDLVQDGIDAVIRGGDLSDSTLMSRRLGGFTFLLCASPDYLAARGTPGTPEALATHDVIRFRYPSSGKFQEWSLRGATAPRFATTLSCSNMEAVRAATLLGLGIAYMPDFLARDAIADGRLHSLLDGYQAAGGQFSILWPSSRHLSPKLRVFVDFVCERLFRK